jgi:hypothetical protein
VPWPVEVTKDVVPGPAGAVVVAGPPPGAAWKTVVDDEVLAADGALGAASGAGAVAVVRLTDVRVTVVAVESTGTLEASRVDAAGRAGGAVGAGVEPEDDRGGGEGLT